MFPLKSLVLLSLVGGAYSHASMAVPPPRSMHGKPIHCYHKEGKEHCNAGCTEQNCLWYQVGCMVGCDSCLLEGKSMWPTPADVRCALRLASLCIVPA